MQYLFHILTFGSTVATFLAALILWDEPSTLNMLLATGAWSLTVWSAIMADHCKMRRKTKQLIAIARAAKQRRSI
jgi:hypothetical protein